MQKSFAKHDGKLVHRRLQCCAGTFHPRTMFRKAKYISLATASSLGKWPRLFNTFRSFMKTTLTIIKFHLIILYLILT